MPQIVEVVKRHLNKMTPVVNGAPLSMKPAFMNLFLVLNVFMLRIAEGNAFQR